MKIRGAVVGIAFITVAIFLSTIMCVRATWADGSLLDLLQKKGVLTKEEVENQKKEMKEEKAAWKNEGFVSSLRRHNIQLYGRLQPKYTYIPSDHSTGKNTTSSFEFRRARLGVMGTIIKDIDFNFQYESAATSNATSLLDAYITFKQFDDYLGWISVGQQYATIEDLNSSGKTILTERTFPQLMLPSRAKGVTIGKGQGDVWYGKGFFNDRLGYWVGIFNGPDTERKNDNGDHMYTGKIMLTPFGSLTGDEYNIKFSPLKVQLSVGAATSRDFNAAVTGSPTIKVKDNWYTSAFQLEYNGWFFMSQWAKKSIDVGNNLPKRETEAYFFGGTRSFALPAKGQFLGIGFAWQKIDNEDPSLTSLFGPRSATSSGLSFNKGYSYHPVINYMIRPNIRLQTEYGIYHEEGVKIKNNSLFSMLTLDF